MRWQALNTVALICGVIFFGTLNNFTKKMLTVTMGNLNFVTGIVDNWVHLVVNAIIVSCLFAKGTVTRAQLAYVFRFGLRWENNGIWKYIAIASVNDVANQMTGLASQNYLTTLMMSLMDQATTPFTVICSFVMLGTRYTALESFSVLWIFCAAIFAVFAAEKENSGDNDPFWAAFAAITTCFAAVSFVLKEMAFRQYADFQKHRELANENGQGLPSTQTTDMPVSTCPLMRQRGVSSDMPETLNVFLVSLIVSIGGAITAVPIALINRAATEPGSATQAMFNGFDSLIHSDNALPVYVIGTIINYIFNFCLLALTSNGSALLAFASLKVVVPCTALCSLFSWPLIGPKTVSQAQWIVLAVMLIALGLFRYGNIQREQLGVRECCWPFRFGFKEGGIVQLADNGDT
eukprot:TRINITY_DN69824_c0_g1_i1.p1 TRINITY_DN69824_c0_g1~~TRINITY_DN69824_c0_g1_i1.p1  ORF type:complete len:406 (+),score=38.48 TRINITY_DN69824_c0_g1_i1:77-1294(+)